MNGYAGARLSILIHSAVLLLPYTAIPVFGLAMGPVTHRVSSRSTGDSFPVQLDGSPCWEGVGG